MGDNNIVIKITSEADLNSAQKQIADLAKQSDDLAKRMSNISDEEKRMANGIKSAAERIKDQAAREAFLAKRLAENKKNYKELRQELKNQIKEAKQSIKELENQVKAYNTLNGMSGKVVQQLRAMRERLMEMEDAGEFGTEAFIKLSIAAGKLEDQLDDTRQRIRVLSSDTKNLDAAMGLGDGLAGAFYIATSSAELFGDDMEGLQKAFYKVQAAMSIFSGVQQVFNALNKDSAAMVVLNTALTKIYAKAKGTSAAATAADAGAATADTAAKGAQAIATGVATKAQLALNAAFMANPLGFILGVIVAVTAGVYALVKGISALVFSLGEAGKASREYEATMKRLEQLQAKNAVNSTYRADKNEQNLKKIDSAEKKHLQEAKKRNASELEMSKISANAAQQRADEQKRYYEENKGRYAEEAALAKQAMDAKAQEAAQYADGSSRKKEALEELASAQQTYSDAVQKQQDLYWNMRDAADEAADAEQRVADVKKDYAQQVEDAQIAAMRNGSAKEIAQIRVNFKRKIEEIKGNSEEEIALRKALEAQMYKEIGDVQRSYARQSKSSALTIRGNYIDAMGDGRAKEIANAKNQMAQELANISEEETNKGKLRASIRAKWGAEIRRIEAKWAQRNREAGLQELQNDIDLLAQKEQLTEEDYAKLLKLRKDYLDKDAAVQKKGLQTSDKSAKERKAEIEKIDLEVAKQKKELDDAETLRKAEKSKREIEIEVATAEAIKNIIRGDESLDEQIKAYDDYYAARKKQIEQNAEAEKAEINLSQESEEAKAQKILLINKQTEAELLQITKEAEEAMLNIRAQALGEYERKVTETETAVERAQTSWDKISALEDNLDAKTNLYNAQMKDLESKWQANLITYEDYLNQRFEITKNIADAEYQYQADKMQALADGFSTTLSYIQQVSDIAFDALGSNVQAELDALEEMYTTDWQEAQKDANKKYITQKEYDKKKAALEEKQAKYQKSQAIINAAIQTALAVVTTLAQLGATPWGIAASVIAAAMGAAQIAVIAAKPLAQYAKGRNGGEGEYAMVGEKGPEIMYIPNGASIVPNNKIGDMDSWGDYGVPKLSVPAMPSVSERTLRYAAEQTIVPLNIDYDKIGASVASHLPKQQAVSVHVDRNGVRVSDGGNNRTYLNAKYTGSWN